MDFHKKKKKKIPAVSRKTDKNKITAYTYDEYCTSLRLCDIYLSGKKWDKITGTRKLNTWKVVNDLKIPSWNGIYR